MPVPTALSCHPHIAITRWAVAGGVLGYPVHVVFQDYPAPIIAAVYRKHVSWLKKENIFSVFGLRDFHQLAPKLDAVRLVLVFDPKQLVKTCWLLDMHRSAAEQAHKSSPSLFSCLATNPAGDLPGPTLVLHGYSPKAKSLETWLEQDFAWPSLTVDSPPTALEFHPRLTPLVASSNARPESPLGLRDRQILKGLLAGAALVQKGLENGTDLLAELEVYRAVYNALKSPATQPVDEAFDPLTLAMVRRANVFLAMKAKSEEPKVARADAGIGPDQEPRTITRREIADLGNIRGETVKRLVEFLLQQGAEGLKKFCTIGTNRAIEKKEGWPLQDVQQLVRLLLPWGPKQVRTRFAHLQAQGLITAERAAANQPWIYRLPEALSSTNSPFRSLPKPDDLERGAIAAGKEVP